MAALGSSPTIDPKTGVLTNASIVAGPTPTATPDWLKQLLPVGGKVSLSIQHPTTAAAPSPNAQPIPQVPTKPAAPAVDTNPNDGTWWNPYTGKEETIPGVNAQGVVTDPNAFWAYYSKNKNAVLDTLAGRVAGTSGTTQWQKPIDYQSLVTGNADYQSGLGDINQQRWNAALAYGDPSLYGQLGLTADQQTAIANNPNSAIAALKRTKLQQDYNSNSTSAAHGAWSSGARQQDLENNALDNIRNTAAAHDAAQQQLEGFTKAQGDLFKSVKDQMEKDGKFDSGDQEHNQALFNATHKAVTQASANVDKLIGQITSIHSVTDARNMIHAIEAALRDYGKMMTPAQKAKLIANRTKANDFAHAMLKASKARTRPATSKTRKGSGLDPGIAGGAHFG